HRASSRFHSPGEREARTQGASYLHRPFSQRAAPPHATQLVSRRNGVVGKFLFVLILIGSASNSNRRRTDSRLANRPVRDKVIFDWDSGHKFPAEGIAVMRMQS